MKYKSEQEIKEFLTPFAEKLNVSVWNVELKKGKNPELNIYLDKEGGMDLDTCELFHKAIDVPLDEFDPTYSTPYTLNVNSKGIDWAFRTEEHYLSHIGQRVEVKLVNSIKGKKFYDGILVAYNKNNVTLKVDEKNTFTIDLKNVVKMNEYIDFE